MMDVQDFAGILSWLEKRKGKWWASLQDHRVSLNTQRAANGEVFFRQTKKFLRIVVPMRRNFVTYEGKSTVVSLCDEFLEMPHIL